MTDLAQLYQSVILDHCKNPRNCRKVEGANRSAEGYNPLCGDRLTLWVRVDGEKIVDIGFEGAGNSCAISKASASLMTLAVKGKSRTEVEGIFQAFHDMVTKGIDAEAARAELGKLAVFSGVSEFPSRVKCASLSWHTLRNALESGAPLTEPPADAAEMVPRSGIGSNEPPVSR